MDYKVNIEGFEGQNIEVKFSFWTGSKLFANGERAPKGKRWGEMMLRRNDGREVSATWKPQMLGFDVPQLVVDGKTISLIEPLKWYQILWGGAPILLVFVGGALGAIAGIIGFSINAGIFRSKIDHIVKYLLSGVVSVAAVVVYFIAAILFTMLING